MKQITIKVPDNCELKQDGNTYTIVKKEKKLTYNDVAKELFSTYCYYISPDSSITNAKKLNNPDYIKDATNCTSKRQAEKLLAINKLMNVAKYLNGDWQPDWDYPYGKKYYIYVDENEKIKFLYVDTVRCSDVYFKSAELAQQAVEILGEETIKLALCTDY